MKNKVKSNLNFLIDPSLLHEDRAHLLQRFFFEEKIKYFTDDKSLDDFSFLVIFTLKKNFKKFSRFKNKIIVIDSNENSIGPFETINFNLFEEIASFVRKIYLLEKRHLIQSKIKESEKVLDEIKNLNSSKSAEELVPKNPDQSREFEAILDLEMFLLKEESLKNWNIHFKNFSKKSTKVLFMAIFNSNEIMQDNGIDENTLVFNLPFNDLFLIIKFKNFLIEEHAQSIEIMLSMLLQTLQLHDFQLIKSDGEIDFWKKIFSKLPYPMSVISDLGDLLIYNESFAKIGILPKECLGFKDHESLEIFQQFYKVRRIEFVINKMEVSFFVFYTHDIRFQEFNNVTNNKSDSRMSSVDELGIISSSIAHELNNPLAGILAAISLLSLEDDWSNDDLDDLNDMKNGAKRCKELIEIFLGFSKFAPSAIFAPSVHQSLDQALNLLRFRMIESNIRLEIRYTSTLENFSHQINSSIMSMILYLLLSELMTAFAHERLITQNSLNIMGGEVLEFTNQIILKLEHDFEYEEKIVQSKLIQHLLIFEKLEINFLRGEIRLIYR